MRDSLGCKLAYLCLQSTRTGQAAYAHVMEIVSGLEDLGWIVDVIRSDCKASRSFAGILRKALDMILAQWQFIRLLRNARVAYVRAHHAAFPAIAMLKA